MDAKSILKAIGFGAAGLGATALNTATGGLTAPLTQQVLSIIGAHLPNPELKAQVDAAAVAAQVDLEKAELDHAEKIMALDQADRSSARARQMAVKDVVPSILAGGVTLGFFSLLTMLIFRSIPESSKAVVYVMIGSLGTAWISIIGYYFGSSAGSDKKTDIITELKAEPVRSPMGRSTDADPVSK